MSADVVPPGELMMYKAEDGKTRIECRFSGETLWLSQAQMAELFQTTPQNGTLHLKALYEEGEINKAATCKDFLQVRTEGKRETVEELETVARQLEPTVKPKHGKKGVCDIIRRHDLVPSEQLSSPSGVRSFC
jgi:hypothetical protein